MDKLLIGIRTPSPGENYNELLDESEEFTEIELNIEDSAVAGEATDERNDYQKYKEQMEEYLSELNYNFHLEREEFKENYSRIQGELAEIKRQYDILKSTTIEQNKQFSEQKAYYQQTLREKDRIIMELTEKLQGNSFRCFTPEKHTEPTEDISFSIENISRTIVSIEKEQAELLQRLKLSPPAYHKSLQRKLTKAKQELQGARQFQEKLLQLKISALY